MSENVGCVRVGSRKSELALIQTNHVIDQLKKANPETQFEVVAMSTTGDKILNVALSKIGEKSLFTKELEIALEKKQVDFVVHSLKDLPTVLADEMVIGGVLEREDPRDAVIMKKGSSYSSLADLPPQSVIGTSSLRRSSQLKASFPNLQFEDIRGNLNTRLRKLDDVEGKYAAIILAVAGITRMGWGDRISQYLEAEHCMHAVGQGALGVECREGDSETISLISSLHHRDTVLRCVAERSFLRALEGGCSVPIGVNSTLAPTSITLCGGVWSLDGKDYLKEELSVEFTSPPAKQPKTATHIGIVGNNLCPAELDAAEKCGKQLADRLLSQGAERILQQARADKNSGS